MGATSQIEFPIRATVSSRRLVVVLWSIAAVSFAAALVMCLRCQGQFRIWWMMPLAYVAGCAAASPAFRGGIIDAARSFWAACASDSPDDAVRRGLAAVAFVVFPAATVFISAKDPAFMSLDSWAVVPTAVSVLRHGRADLSDYRGLATSMIDLHGQPIQPYFLADSPRGLYSSYPAGMTAFAIPFVAAAQLVGADLDNLANLNKLQRWIAIWVAAWTLGLFFLTALHLAPPGPAWFATMLLAFGSSLFTTNAQALWQQTGIAFWLMIMMLAEFRHARCPTRITPMIQGIAAGMMAACRPSTALILIPFGLWCLMREPKRAVLMGLVATIVFAPWMAFHHVCYGTWVGPSAHQMQGGNWSRDFVDSMFGVWISPGRGLFIYQPWLLLLPLVWFCRERRTAAVPRGWTVYCAIVIVMEATLVGAWGMWWGGYSWGSRLLADVVPLAGLMTVPAVAFLWRDRRWGFIAVVAAASILVHAPGVFFDAPCVIQPQSPGEASPLWRWSPPPFLAPWWIRAS